MWEGIRNQERADTTILVKSTHLAQVRQLQDLFLQRLRDNSQLHRENKYALKNSENCLCSFIARTKLAATWPAGIVIVAKPKPAQSIIIPRRNVFITVIQHQHVRPKVKIFGKSQRISGRGKKRIDVRRRMSSSTARPSGYWGMKFYRRWGG